MAPGRGGAGCTKFDMADVGKADGPDGIRGFVAKTDERRRRSRSPILMTR